MRNFFKKTILLLTLAGIVFLGGGGGVARAESTATAAQTPANTSTPATPRDTNTNVDTIRTADASKGALDLIQCGGFWDKLSLGCIMPVLTYNLYVVTMGVLMLSGYLFDNMLALSIDKKFIEPDFVGAIWKVMRDFSNMMFIFILLYTGIRTMLFGDDWKKPVMMVVVIALLINFSLFFTKIVIDAGNILAMGVYSGMGVNEGTSVSAAFTNGFKPQQFFNLSVQNKDLSPTIFIIAGVVSGFLAFVLFKAAFLFMGRLLAFWFLMVISPFAFILIAFPQLGAKIKFSFSAWLDMLINQTFVAPVFLFFIYIITTVIQANIFDSLKTPSGAGALMDLLFIPIVITGMIIYALKKALSVAENMSGEFGKIGADIGNKALGLGLALGTGGVSLAGRGVIGQGAAKVLESGYFKNMAEKGGVTGFMGRQGKRFSTELSKSSFDARGIGFVAKALKGEKIDAGKAQKGGYVADRKAAEKKATEEAKEYEVTQKEKEAEATRRNPEYAKAQRRRERHYQEAREATIDEATMRTRAESTNEHGSVRVAKNTMSTAKMEGDRIIKKINDLKKMQAKTELDLKERKNIQDEIDREEDMKKRTNDIMEKASGILAEAEMAYRQTAEYKQLEKAVKIKEGAMATLQNTEKIIKDTEKELGDWENAKNELRRERIGYAQTFPHFYYTKADREVAVRKVRAAKTKEERGKEKSEKDLAKFWKKMNEEITKKESGGESEEKTKEETPSLEAEKK